MKPFYLILIVVLQSVTMISQNKFQPGSYTDSDGKMHTGYIKKEKWDINPTKIFFKTNKEQKSFETITINDLTSFYLDGAEYFKKEKISVDIRSEVSSQTLVEKQVLLNVLLDGAASLYYYGDDLNKNFYYSLNDSSPILLNQKRGSQNGKYVLDINKVRQELLNSLSACSSITGDRIKKVSYKKASLFYILSEYNECLNATQKPYWKNNIDFNLSLFSGFNFSTYNDFDLSSFRNDGILTTATNNADFGSASDLIYGLEVEILNKEYNFSGFVGVTFVSAFEASGEVSISGSGGGEVGAFITSNFTTLTAGAKKYINLKKDLYLYLGIGLSIHFPSNYTIRLEGDVVPAFRDFGQDINFAPSAGLQYKFLFVESRFQPGQKVFDTNITNIYFMVGAKFL